MFFLLLLGLDHKCKYSFKNRESGPEQVRFQPENVYMELYPDFVRCFSDICMTFLITNNLQLRTCSSGFKFRKNYCVWSSVVRVILFKPLIRNPTENITIFFFFFVIVYRQFCVPLNRNEKFK